MSATDTRTLQRTIHAACRELGIDADARRDVQLAVTGTASMADMTTAQLQAVIAHLKVKGFAHKPRGGGRAPARNAQVRYIHVLWSLLGKAGVLKKPGRTGLNAFIRESFAKAWGAVPLDVDMLEDPAHVRAVTEALKAWCKRVGVEVQK